MFNFIHKFIYFFLSVQEKLLAKKLGGNFKPVYSNTTSKKAFGRAATLELNCKTNQNKEKVKNNVELIVRKYENDPKKLLEFVERQGTSVYKIRFADKILGYIGHEEGFITQTKGIKAIYLNICLAILGQKVKITAKTEPMFVMRDFPPNSCYFLQQFYKWYAMKFNLPGFDASSQENFQKFLAPGNDDKIQELSVEEILGLKEAISRDVEAINFVVELAKSTDGSKNALMKIKAGGASV